ncbi:MAG: divergent polysaccharide deacetylase family protein [Rhodospirillales bacterium]|nr:divergent polysaccharide deacetylase family protein [Rhodospirillales bacterium]MCW8971131.1 divergent polysaccharide deacetylase family protein [Rhodospirillales bacterium]
MTVTSREYLPLPDNDIGKNHRKKLSGGVRLNPVRQLIYVAVAVAAMLIGYLVIPFFVSSNGNGVSPPAANEKSSVQPWYKNKSEAPLLITAPDAPLTHYEEALSSDVYEHPENGARPKASIKVSQSLTAQEGASRVAMAVPDAAVPQVVSPQPPLPLSPASPAVQVADEARVAVLARPPEAPERVEEEGGQPVWLKNAVHSSAQEPLPMVAIVIDDVGIDRRRSRRIIDLPPPLTVSFLPYTHDPAEMAANAHGKGHELMVHVSMEPGSATADPGPNVLMANHDRQELIDRLDWALSRFDGYVGVNNHMGSRFTADPASMATLMEELKHRGLLFLDSRTSPQTVGGDVAALYGVPYAERNVFIDNENNVEAVRRQLRELEALARRKGYAIGIGHPRDATIEALATWLPELSRRGIVLVPLSKIVMIREEKRVKTDG